MSRSNARLPAPAAQPQAVPPAAASEVEALLEGLSRALSAGAAPAVQAHAQALLATLRKPGRLAPAQVQAGAEQLRRVRAQLARRSAAVERELSTLLPERHQTVTYGALRPGARLTRH